MRVCIIGFDSLDYYLVEKYDLRYLMQKEYGKVEINMVLSTPTIWTSFITALPPEEHGIVGLKWENPFLDKLKKWGVKIGLNRVFDRSEFLAQLLRKKILKGKGSIPNIKGRLPTIFDYAQSLIDITVPCYSEDTYEDIRREMAYAIGNPIAENKMADKAWKVFMNKRKRVLDELNKDWDLFMVHFFLPDVIQHLLWYREDEIERLYREMDDTAHIIKRNLEKNVFILFISDHGQKRGLHTPHAFYSCNQILNLHEPKITDFGNIIKREIGAPTKSEIESVKNRLKELGYF